MQTGPSPALAVSCGPWDARATDREAVVAVVGRGEEGMEGALRGHAALLAVVNAAPL